MEERDWMSNRRCTDREEKNYMSRRRERHRQAKEERTEEMYYIILRSSIGSYDNVIRC